MENLNVQLPPKVKIILQKLNKAGFEGYIVGGCVRDLIMGRNPNDWDITTSARPEKVKEIFPRTYDTGLEHGTVTVRMDKDHYELTTYRTEGQYKDHRRPEDVSFVKDITLDLSRRDFTMNAIAYHPEEGFKDPFSGVRDIKAKTIRAVGKPDERFEEDALRILRAVRFSAQLDFAIEDKTLESMLEKAPLLKHISKERIRDEFVKTLLADKEEILVSMYEWEILEYILPEFIDTLTSEQDYPYIYNVGLHTIEALKETPKDLEVRLATLLNYIGKPKVLTSGESYVEKSVKMSKKILRTLRFDNKTIKKVALLVEHHNFTSQKDVTVFTIKEVLSELGPDLFEKLLAILQADARAKNPDKLETRLDEINFIEKTFKEIIKNEECYNLKDLAINGGDLVKLGIKEGRQIGFILKESLTYVMKNPSKNDKDHLLKRIEK